MRRRVRGTAIAAAAVLGALAGPRAAYAEDLQTKTGTDLPITLGGAGAWVVSEGLRGDLVHGTCRWCDRDAAGHDTLNPLDREVRRRLRWRRRHLADEVSNMTAFVLTPATAGGSLAVAASHDSRSQKTSADLLIVAEAGVITADVNQLVKFLVVRERPDAHARALADPAPRVRVIDDDLSFYSGHTTESVAIAVAAGTVASLRGYRLAPLVWGTSLPLALTTGYLRIGADRHYFTDVLAGGVAGAVIGFAVPFLFHRSSSVPATAASGGTPSPSAAVYTFGYSGLW